jgi:DNA-binding NarL/FixJ family response regulator
VAPSNLAALARSQRQVDIACVPESAEGVSDRIAIVLADDHAVVRAGLRRVLESQPGVLVVAEVGDIPEALHATSELQPNIVLLDLHMPGPPTLEAIPRFIEAAPGCFVLVLTMEKEPTMARSVLGAGANGYVLKDAAESELIDAVRAVMAGRTYLDPSLGAALAKTWEQSAAFGMAGLDPASLVGANLAGHRIDALRGRGGMGVVFRATDLKLERTVALKLIAPGRRSTLSSVSDSDVSVVWQRQSTIRTRSRSFEQARRDTSCT